MITKVIIENFQSHKKTEVDFIAGTNVIIGESDTGKSAIFRAINWVVSNRPLGDSYRSEWGGDTRVILHTSEGHVIERLRTASKNEYIIDGQVLKAFGSEPPAEVGEILQIDSFNIQEQMESPFLLSSTPGEAARMLNKAASIDAIDKTISGLKKSLNQLNSEILHNEQRLKQYSAEMKQYENLPEIESRVERVEGLEEEKESISKRIKDVRRLSERVKWVSKELEQSNHIPPLFDRVEESEKQYSDYQTEETKSRRLHRIITRVGEIEGILEQTKGIEDILIQAEKAGKEITSLKESVEKGIILRSRVIRIKEILSSISRVENEIKKLTKDYDLIAPETCPLCGAEMKEVAE